jgi:hypothetical protein
MAEAGCHPIPLGTTACCEQEAIAHEHLAIGQLEGKAVVLPLYLPDRRPNPQLDPGLVSSLPKTIDNRCRIITGGEDASIRFGLETNPSLFKPADCVPRLKATEGTTQFLGPPRIMFNQFAGLKAGMGDIAASPARNPHFGQGL